MNTLTDLLSDRAVRDPYGYLGALREAAPVHRDETLGAWLVLRYDDVRAAFRDQRLSSDRVTGFFARREAAGTMEEVRATADILTRWIVFADPPRHTRLRKLADYRVPAQGGGAHARVDHGAGGRTGRRGGRRGRDRFRGALRAGPLPVRVICNLFGVPAREHRADLTRWSRRHADPAVRRRAPPRPARTRGARLPRVLRVPAHDHRRAPRAAPRRPRDRSHRRPGARRRPRRGRDRRHLHPPTVWPGTKRPATSSRTD